MRAREGLEVLEDVEDDGGGKSRVVAALTRSAALLLPRHESVALPDSPAFDYCPYLSSYRSLPLCCY